MTMTGDRVAALAFYRAAEEACANQNNPQRLILGYQLFASSVMADRDWWQSIYQAGNNSSDLEHNPSAIACWRRALECEMEPQEKAKVHCNLSWRLQCSGQIVEALEHANISLELDPTLRYSYVNMALIHGTMDDPDKALDYARQAYSFDPNDTTCEMCLAFQLLYAGRFAEGLKHFEARFPYKLKNYLDFPYPKWTGQQGKTVFVAADQGLGDTLTFARFLPEACKRSKFVYAYIQPELMRLFTHAFSSIRNLTLLPSNTPFPAADYWSTYMSLPFALALSDEEIREAPAYRAYPGRDFDQNWKVPGAKLHIGCCWGGSPQNDIDKHRSFPVTQLLELYRVPGVQLYSLQVGDRGKDMHDAGMAPVMRDLTPYIRDVSNTVALLQDLDMVVSCESALPHIASLIDRETWIPYSYMGRDYRIGHSGEHMLWRKNQRIFRQRPDMQWAPVFRQMVAALQQKMDELDKPMAA